MPIESATFISQLSPSDPPGSDKKHQGDDHLRLIKQVLRNSFPNLDKAFNAPQWQFPTSSFVVSANDNNVVFFVNTLSGDVNVTLPVGVQANFHVRILKSTGDQSVVRVIAASGSIFTENGQMPITKIAVAMDPVDFLWTGSQYWRVRHGDAIGSIAMFPAIAIPVGYIRCDGQNISSTDNPELGVVFAGLFGNPGAGLVTLPNFADRFPVGAGFSYPPGAIGGANAVALSVEEMPLHNHNVAISDPGHNHTLTDNTALFGNRPGAAGIVGGASTGFANVGIQGSVSNISLSQENRGSSQAHENRPPYFAMHFTTKLA